MVDLGTLGGNSSWANAVNNLGQAAGWSTTVSTTHAALWSVPLTARITQAGTVDLGPITLTFSSINSAGTVTAFFVSPNTPPENFIIVGGTSYNITTDVISSGTVTVTVCIGYDPAKITVPEQQLRLYHYSGGWTDITQFVDTVNNKVCGLTSSFSIFAVAEPTSVPFSALSDKLRIHAGPPPSFDLNASFTLSGSSNGIDPIADLVALQVGTYSVTIPAGSFQQLKSGSKKGTYVFSGVINGVTLSIQMVPPNVTGDGWNFKASATPVDLSGLSNPVTVIITIGDDSGTTAVNAIFD